MTSTYEIIKALPAKGYNWAGFTTALRARYVESCDAKNRDAGYLPECDAALSTLRVRECREICMRMATIIVDHGAVSSRFIPPSEETLAWGGFLSGETVVLRDGAADEILTEEVRALAQKFYHGRG